jgi:hypothetical protein
LNIGDVLAGEVGNVLSAESSADMGLDVFRAGLVAGGSPHGGCSPHLVDERLVNADGKSFACLIDHDEYIVFTSHDGE